MKTLADIPASILRDQQKGYPRLRMVIESQIQRGAGDSGDPIRLVTQYHSTIGEYLAEMDSK